MTNSINFHSNTANITLERAAQNIWGIELTPTKEQAQLKSNLEKLGRAMETITTEPDYLAIVETSPLEEVSDNLRDAVRDAAIEHQLAGVIHNLRSTLHKQERQGAKTNDLYDHNLSQLPIEATTKAFIDAATALAGAAHNSSQALAHNAEKLQTLMVEGEKLSSLKGFIRSRDLPAIGTRSDRHQFIATYVKTPTVEQLEYGIIHGKKTITSPQELQDLHAALGKLADDGVSNLSETLIKLAQGAYGECTLEPAQDFETFLERFHNFDNVGKIKPRQASTRRAKSHMSSAIPQVGLSSPGKKLDIPGKPRG